MSRLKQFIAEIIGDGQLFEEGHEEDRPHLRRPGRPMPEERRGIASEASGPETSSSGMADTRPERPPRRSE
jgi:hypothetical protein